MLQEGQWNGPVGFFLIFCVVLEVSVTSWVSSSPLTSEASSDKGSVNAALGSDGDPELLSRAAASAEANKHKTSLGDFKQSGTYTPTQTNTATHNKSKFNFQFFLVFGFAH